MITFFTRVTLASATLVVLCSANSAQAGQSTAIYDIRFDANWTAATHPSAFTLLAHFSPLIGATHNSGYSLWEPGGLATSGVESMAETGSTFGIMAEVQAAALAGTAGQMVFGNGALGVDSVTAIAIVTDEFPLLSLTTMIAPSPDWFVGVHGVNLLENGIWQDNLVVDLLAYDAGTDSGPNFTGPNQNTNPQEPISLITGGPFTGTDPLGTFTFARRVSTLSYGCQVLPGSFQLISGLPDLGAQLELELADPSASMELPSLAYWSIAAAPDANFPCGTPLPGFGLGSIGSDGEFLIGVPTLTRFAGVWNGTPIGVNLSIPSDPTLSGFPFYMQGFMIDSTSRVGLTSAMEFLIGT